MQTLSEKLRILWISFWTIFNTCLLFIPITLAALLSSTGNLAFSLSKIWAWLLLKVTYVRPEIKGKEKIRKGQSYIIITNHQSQYDILALVTMLGIQFRWVIKNELRKAPLFGYALYASRNIFIDRSDPKQAISSIQKGMDRLPDGVSVLFFAEGTRSPDGKIQKFKRGGFVTAIVSGLPILPVTVNGGRKILPKKSLAFKPGPIEVVVGEPIETQGYSQDRVGELLENTRDVIISQFKPDYPES